MTITNALSLMLALILLTIMIAVVAISADLIPICIAICKSFLKKLPIIGSYMYRKELQGKMGICLSAKERLLWVNKHEYIISNIICPNCGFKDCRRINNHKYWCIDCNSYWDIPSIELVSMPNKLPKNWRGRELR
jgi:ribosomal protein L37AE/L43A